MFAGKRMDAFTDSPFPFILLLILISHIIPVWNESSSEHAIRERISHQFDFFRVDPNVLPMQETYVYRNGALYTYSLSEKLHLVAYDWRSIGMSETEEPYVMFDTLETVSSMSKLDLLCVFRCFSKSNIIRRTLGYTRFRRPIWIDVAILVLCWIMYELLFLIELFEPQPQDVEPPQILMGPLEPEPDRNLDLSDRNVDHLNKSVAG